MTYNNLYQNPGASYGSRGKGSHLRNISVASSNNLAAPSENQPVPTPRSARSALLAGLRTAPKAPTPHISTSGAEVGYDNSRYAGITAPSPGFNQYSNSQRLPTPPSLASPTIHVNDGSIDEYDEESYQQMQIMMAQNAYFAHMQQQIAAAQKVQQLQQQLAQLQMQSGVGYAGTPPMSPGMGIGGLGSLYNNAGLYSQYGQYNPYQQQLAQAQAFYGQQQQTPQSPVAQVEVSPPTPIEQHQPTNLSLEANRSSSRSRSPPKLNLQQSNNTAQNSAAAAGFRRGHRKASSLSTCTNINSVDVADPPKTAVPKFPPTPTTATFGPGHASGTHPIRQPRGPPSIEELKAKPTSKDEGSKNFATRQRRRAISRLVSAGIERRSAKSTSGSASVGSTMTPVSEHDGFNFEESESVGSSAGRQSRQSLRDYEQNNSSADEGSVTSRPSARGNGGLKAPSLVLSAAEKRKSALF
jgi:hypothetical protein